MDVDSFDFLYAFLFHVLKFNVIKNASINPKCGCGPKLLKCYLIIKT